MNDDLYFFCVVFVTSNMCRRDSCFEDFGQKKSGHLLAASYVRRKELQQRHGRDVQASLCLLDQRTKRDDNASKKQSLVVRSFDHDIPPSTLGKGASIPCL